ncbi:sugar transferase [Candidatus Collinsella stercoripullorum]|uniref:sugar transferase n=1 Tax=Candidatus Collinsella stercoripullorum TaxID=2838522 RepID=UPI0022E3C75C|nr:sugar transferase [Candidatus Collinsella stercoripullorum]
MSAELGTAGSVVEQLADAAGAVGSEREARAVMSALGETPGLTESAVAPDVLARLLPDDEVVELPALARVGGGPAYRAAKRAFDVVSCSCALVLLAVPMAAIAFKIKRESPGPAIYAQTRVGKGGRLFKVYKFRSMYVDAEARGAQWAQGEDPRVTPFGRRLRNSRLDEIPQFWNVVRGDMSLIGPRPERPVFHEAFKERIHGWEQRLAVRPGITGLAQVEGGYELLPKEKALLDIEYIENRGILLDVKIMLRTLGVMRTGEGAR